MSKKLLKLKFIDIFIISAKEKTVHCIVYPHLHYNLNSHSLGRKGKNRKKLNWHKTIQFSISIQMIISMDSNSFNFQEKSIQGKFLI